MPPSLLHLRGSLNEDFERVWRSLAVSDQRTSVKPSSAEQECHDQPAIRHSVSFSENIPEVVMSVRAAIKRTGISADDPSEVLARGKYISAKLGQLFWMSTSLMDSYSVRASVPASGPSSSRLHSQPSESEETVPQTNCGYTAFVQTKISNVIAALGISADSGSDKSASTSFEAWAAKTCG